MNTRRLHQRAICLNWVEPGNLVVRCSSPLPRAKQASPHRCRYAKKNAATSRQPCHGRSPLAQPGTATDSNVFALGDGYPRCARVSLEPRNDDDQTGGRYSAVNPRSSLYWQHPPPFARRIECCIDRLRSPREADTRGILL